MLSGELRAQIRHWFYAEHWKVGTIAQQLGVHPDTVRHAPETEQFNRAKILRPRLTDPYLEFIRQTLQEYPRLRATRIYQMIRERGYTGSVVQLRRVVARLRPVPQQSFLRLRCFPGEQGQVDWAHFGEVPSAGLAGVCRAFSSPFPTRVPCIWNSSSIKAWKTFCVVMSTPFKLGPANHESFSTITSAVPCWNDAATRFTFILGCWTCARIITLLLVPVRYGPEIKKGAWSEPFFMCASRSGPAERLPLWKS